MESKNILIKDAIIISDEIKKGSLLIQNDKIVEISDKISINDADEVINADGKILIPGLVNTHTHLINDTYEGFSR